MKGKLIVIFFISMFILGIIPGGNVRGAYLNYVGTFSSGIVGQQYSDTYFSTIDYYSPTGSNNVSFATNDKAYECVSNSQSVFVLKYSSGMELNIFQMFHSHIATCQYADTIKFFFYNSTHSTYPGNQAMIVMYGTPSLMEFGFYNATGTPTAIDGMAWGRFNGSVLDSYFGFTITDYEVGTAMYYCEESTTDYESRSAVEGEVRIPSYFELGYRIDRVAIEVSLGSATYLNNVFDNIWYYAIGVNVTPPPPETECGTDFDNFNKIGLSETLGSYVNINYAQIYNVYNVYSQAHAIRGVELGVAQRQYELDPNINNYRCEILGYNIGTPVCFFKRGVDYILTWECNIELGGTIPGIPSGQMLIAQFWHTNKLEGNINWYINIGQNPNQDLDSDGDSEFKYGNQVSGGGVPTTVFPYDLGMSWFLENPYPHDTYNYTDSLGLANNYDINSTGYLFHLANPDGICVSYLLSTDAYDYKIEIFKNGSVTPDTQFDYIYYPSGEYCYLPSSIGKYVFRLSNYHPVYNVTAYVLGVLPDFYIATSPPLTNAFDSYYIFYEYFHPQGYTGLIGIFDNVNDSNDYTKAKYSYTIGVNVSDSKLYSSTSLVNEFIGLFVDSPGYPRVADCQHNIRNFNVGGNTLLVSTPTLEINLNNPEDRAVYITGEHTFLGGDISIYVNGNWFCDVSNNQKINVEYIPRTARTYHVSLVLRQDTGLTYFPNGNATFNVVLSDSENPTPPGQDLGGLLPPPYSYIMGAIITIALMILPSIALGKIGISGSEMLKYVPIFSGTMGFILSCLIGFFPWYSIFALLFVLILIIVVLYLSKNK